MEEPPPDVPVAPAEAAVETHLPMEERADGTLVIDLTPLTQAAQECDQPEPDPINPEIVVCRTLDGDQRVSTEPEVDDFGNAIPRAQVQLSESTRLSLDAEQKPVGNTPADAALVRITIDF